MWREIRLLSREKPVIASMVDVAASGGYYIGMACDQIVAEDLTVTGSIGVVTAKFNAQELNRKIGYVVETVSRGRYAEILSTSRGFTEEEDSYFADGARQAYLSFITKAAASRNMTVEGMNEVAQGRVWTGAQAKRRGLVDHSGGLWRSLQIAASMAKLEINGTSPSTLRIQTLREPRSGFMLPFASLLGMSFDSGSTTGSRLSADMSGPLVICDDAVAGTGLVSDSSLGISPLLRSLGCGPLVAYLASRSTVGREVLGKLPTDATAITSIMSNLLK